MLLGANFPIGEAGNKQISNIYCTPVSRIIQLRIPWQFCQLGEVYCC